MKKEELKKKLGQLKYIPSGMPGFAVMELVDQLDEPAKVVVPSFVAEWYEKNKNEEPEFTMYKVVIDHYEGRYKNWNPQMDEWLSLADNKPIETLVRMRDGYEVEEKRYRVIFPTLGGWNERMAIMSNGSNYYIEEITDPDYEVAELTEAEIKAIHEGYWAFAEEVTE